MTKYAAMSVKAKAVHPTFLPSTSNRSCAGPYNQEEEATFGYALAHEVRNPLSTINLAVQMLKSNVGDQERHIYLDMIMRGSLRINNLVSEFLHGPQNTDKQEKISIHELLDDVTTMVADRITCKKIMIRKQYTDSGDTVIVNIRKMTLAFTNIIVNAIEAMPAKNGKLTLMTALTYRKCVVKIEDTGMGIHKDNLKNIFKPYYTNKSGGIGLGLATAHDSLLSENAQVEVASVEGRGTSFIVSFNNLRFL